MSTINLQHTAEAIASLNLQRTAEAIAQRDREVPLLWEKMLAAEDHHQILPLMEEIERIEEAVGIAFGEDTKDFNNPQTCRTCIRAGEPEPPLGETDVSFVRRLVRTWRQAQ